MRVRFDLYTFGDWRGVQKATGGPQHRLMFFDNKAKPAFEFDTNFSTNKEYSQSWPERNPATNKALSGGTLLDVDTAGRFQTAHRWPIEFEYAPDSPALRFTILCGAAAGGGKPMPHFAIDIRIHGEVHHNNRHQPAWWRAPYAAAIVGGDHNGAGIVDVDARGRNLVVADSSGNKLRWLSTETGRN